MLGIQCLCDMDIIIFGMSNSYYITLKSRKIQFVGLPPRLNNNNEKKHVKGKGLNLISPNDFENEVHEEFVVFALVAKNVLEKALEEVSAVLKEF